MVKPKKLTQQTVIGQQGVNLIERVVYSMRSIWNPTVVDVGLDGAIELCDPATGHALGCMLFVQSRATEREFQGETETTFEYLCSERELAYWMQGNAPVLLIISRPSTEEAYWVSVKDYFRDPARRASRRVRFHKQRDRFAATSFEALHSLAVPAEKGVYLGPTAKDESLVSNLLRIASYAPRIYVADTHLRKAPEVWRIRDERGIPLPAGWILKDERLIAFHDLREWPWTELCDRGSVEDFDVEEWAASDDADRRRDFVRLMRQCLREKLYPRIVYQKDLDCYMFRRPEGELRPFSVAYRATTTRETTRDVFVELKNKSGKAWCYRHDAFEGAFRRLGGSWYLEINPTFVFTSDGERLSAFHSERLSGIKRLERNPDVRRQVLMWASQLGRGEDLVTPPYPLLVFGDLESCDLQVGIDDHAWLVSGREDGDGRRGVPVQGKVASRRAGQPRRRTARSTGGQVEIDLP